MGTNAGVFVLDTLKKEIRKFELPVSDPDNNEIWELITGYRNILPPIRKKFC
jgi:hypothetical protein